MIIKRIENWALVPLAFNPYRPPEHHALGIHGDVFGHPDFEDGDSITTSVVLSAKVDGDNIVVQTKNNEYLLGSVKPEYEAMYPNARARVIAALQVTS